MPKRDADRMREILLLVESGVSGKHQQGWVQTVGFEHLQETDDYQIQLLVQAGHLEEKRLGPGSTVSDLLRITNNGHDYLDLVRDDNVWKKTKAAVLETGGSSTLELLKNIAYGFVKKKIEDHTGIEL